MSKYMKLCWIVHFIVLALFIVSCGLKFGYGINFQHDALFNGILSGWMILTSVVLCWFVYDELKG